MIRIKNYSLFNTGNLKFIPKKTTFRLVKKAKVLIMPGLFIGVLSVTGLACLVFNFDFRERLKSEFNRLDGRVKIRIKDNLLIQFIESRFQVNPFANYISSLSQSASPLLIDIKFKEYQKILHKRKEALNKGLLIVGENDYIKATINHEGEKYKAKIRLKGDWVDHLAAKKWSYRVHLKNNKTLFGMQKFSLQSPGTRNYFEEWVFHNLLKEEGVPALRYSFIPVKVNGDDLGIYAVEEHFDKLTIESNHYKEGPILKLNESNGWLNKLHGNKLFSNSYLYSHIDLFKRNKTLLSPVQRSYFLKASSLLDGFRRGEYSTSEVFEIDKLAKYFAITDLVGGQHSNSWANMRFYYNPISSKLIPIGYDAQPSKYPITELSIEKTWFLPYFNDQIFIEAYLSQLARVSNPKYLNNFISKNKKNIESNMKILYRSYPALTTKWNIYKENSQIIASRLSPPHEFVTAYMETSTEDAETAETISLSIGNDHTLPVKLLRLVDDFGNTYIPKSAAILPKRENKKLADFKVTNFTLDYSNNLAQVDKLADKHSASWRLFFSVVGSQSELNIQVHNHLSPTSYKKLSPAISLQASNIDDFPFISYIKGSDRFVVRKGDWTVAKPLVIPSGSVLLVGPGTTMNFKQSGFVYSYSPVQFIGSKDEPVRLFGNKNAGGVVVMKANGESILQNVNFSSLSLPSNGQVDGISGSVTFYESDVKIINCSFADNISEDNVNIIRSNFLVSDSSFRNSYSDALDVDFSNGEVVNVFFLESANDGFDVSGSNVKLSGITVKGAGDKAVSIGEESQINAKDITILDAEIAFASKDSSVLSLLDASIANTKVSFAVFQKKPEFGPAKIIGDNINIMPSSNRFVLEQGSLLTINGQSVQPNYLDADAVLYGKFYGKATKSR